ncbi:MAG: histidine--tRNA ligase [Cardiobacteriaceae bacterium]|nr:histidine--tRNA ligase [Cardiobacteriaceae bacterium]
MSREAIQSVRGMRDIFAPYALQLERLHAVSHALLQRYGYLPAQTPLLEKTGLFARSIGEETDIVSKEMYTFADRNDESLTLRPEATAGVVRALIENGMLQQTQRLYVEGPMFRYERPQKGRYRQFTQISVEAFGMADPALDVELMAVSAALFRELGVYDKVTLEINTIGLPEERRAYQQALVAYLQDHVDALDDDSRRRLTTNPLRILDSKDAGVQRVLDGAPVLADALGEASRAHFATVKALLDALGIAYRENPRLVRGLDYYCHSVFEWTTTALGAQGTVCAGGRYDGLVEQLGGKATPAAGFAFGVDRIALLCEDTLAVSAAPDVYAIAADPALMAKLLPACEVLRAQGLRVVVQTDGQSLKNQLKKADKSGAAHALIIGESEAQANAFTLKTLASGEQHTLPLADILARLGIADTGMQA